MLYPGARVELVGTPDSGGPPTGSIGTVVCTTDYGETGVDWDCFFRGHSLGMLLSPKAVSGWWTETSKLKIIYDDDATVKIDPEALFDLVFTGGE